MAAALLAALAPLGCPGDPPQQETTYTLPGDGIFPEGIAVSPERGEYYVSSFAQGTIYRGRLDGTAAEVFLQGGQDGRVSAVGMTVDRQRNRLFIAGGATGLAFVYDLTNGQLIRRLQTSTTPSSDPNNPSTLVNDVTVTPSGDAYLTDSLVPVIYRIPATEITPSTTTGQLEDWLPLANSDTFQYQFGGTLISSINANGIASTANGAYLFVVQTNTGRLYRINASTQMILQVSGVSIPGGDGIVLDGNTLYGIHNDPTPVLRFTLAQDFASGTDSPLPRQPTTVREPSTAALVNGRLLIVNLQFSALFGSGQPQLPFTVTSFPLP